MCNCSRYFGAFCKYIGDFSAEEQKCYKEHKTNGEWCSRHHHDWEFYCFCTPPSKLIRNANAESLSYDSANLNEKRTQYSIYDNTKDKNFHLMNKLYADSQHFFHYRVQIISTRPKWYVSNDWDHWFDRAHYKQRMLESIFKT